MDCVSRPKRSWRLLEQQRRPWISAWPLAGQDSGVKQIADRVWLTGALFLRTSLPSEERAFRVEVFRGGMAKLRLLGIDAYLPVPYP